MGELTPWPVKLTHWESESEPLLRVAERAAGDADRGELESRLAEHDDDASAHYALGSLLAAAEEWEPALEHLLATVRLDRALADDGGRIRMLAIFEVLGTDHQLTQEHRRRLSALLF